MNRFFAALSAATALLATLPANAQLNDTLVAAAAKSPTKKTELMQSMVKGHVFIIATWTSGASKKINIQDFVRNGKSFIPVFSDQQHFKDETRGSGFDSKGISIDGNLFASLLKGNELLVLNPGSKTPVEIDAKALKALVDVGRLPKY
ncbi:MAG: SseB family protein [Betaproteobacteria bacterium]|nr:MAG: SseB family protein [Betaproteobacteria bacterium]